MPKALPPRPRSYVKPDPLFLNAIDFQILMSALFSHEQDSSIPRELAALRLKVLGAIESGRDVVITPDSLKPKRLAFDPSYSP